MMQIIVIKGAAWIIVLFDNGHYVDDSSVSAGCWDESMRLLGLGFWFYSNLKIEPL